MKDSKTDNVARNKHVQRQRKYDANETGDLGREIYVRDIRHKVEPELVGKYVAIDVVSGCWAVGESTMEARNRLGEMRPEAVDVWMEWIGYEAVYSIGGGTPRRTTWSAE